MILIIIIYLIILRHSELEMSIRYLYTSIELEKFSKITWMKRYSDWILGF